MQTLLDWLLAHPETVVFVLLTGAGIIWGKPHVDAVLADNRTKRVLAAGHIAFHAVEEMATKLQLPPGVSKTAAYLQRVDELLLAAGHDTLDALEQPLALVAAKAINSQVEGAFPQAPPA